MIFLLNTPFVLDFAVTFALFGTCFLSVIAIKILVLSVKAYFPKPIKQTPNVKKFTKKPKKLTPKTENPVRSIEINPDEIDRIYVKKIS